MRPRGKRALGCVCGVGVAVSLRMEELQEGSRSGCKAEEGLYLKGQSKNMGLCLEGSGGSFDKIN